MHNLNPKLNPNWVTGFIDAEGCFFVGIYKIKNSTRWSIKPEFMLKLHIRDLDLLILIKSFFKDIGNIYEYKSFAVYRVQSIKNLINTIIPHFNQYPLITEKQNDLKIFINIINIINKEYKDKEDINQIIKLKASLNKGLSLNMKTLFPYLSASERPTSLPIKSINPYWLAGFFSGEGCFMISLAKKPSYKYHYSTRLWVMVGQHSRDKILISRIIELLNSGWLKEKENYTEFCVSNFQDIYSKIIPFFKKYKILGVKSQDFQDFCVVAEYMKEKVHLTQEGVREISIIKSRMNRNRY